MKLRYGNKMYKKLNRILALCTLLAAVITTFAGCGSGDEDAVAGDSATVEWYMQKPVSDMSHQDLVENEANKIISDKLGVKLHFIFIDSAAWKNKMNVIYSSGTPFDLTLAAGDVFTTNMQNNVFMDIKELLNTYAPNIMKKTDSSVWDAVTNNSGIYAVPGQNFYVPYVSYGFKKEFVEKYKFNYKDVSTIDDLEPFLETIKKNEPNIIPLAVSSTSSLVNLTYRDYLPTNINSVLYDIKNDKFISYYDSPDVIYMSRKMNEFFQKGYIAKDAVSKTEITTEIKTGKYAVFGGRRDADKITNLYGFDCVESDPSYGVVSTKNVINAVTAVGRTSKNAKAAIKVLDLIWSDPKLSNLLAYGIEDIDYSVVSGKGTEQISIMPKSGIEVKWSIWHNWLGPLWDQWDSPWNSKKSLEEMKNINSNAEFSPILAFTINNEPIKNEIAQLSAVINEANPVFYTGSMPDFDAYLENVQGKMKQSGIDKVLEEVTKQYKQWKIQKK